MNSEKISEKDNCKEIMNNLNSSILKSENNISNTNEVINLESKLTSSSNDNNIEKIRPETPSIDVIAIRNSGESYSGIIRNFSNFFKQIVSNENKNFLEGEINMIDYIISKYSNISINNISGLVKLHLKVNSEYNLLNQFGEKLPNLKELKLTNSNIPSICDLGTNFKNLQVLIMDNCNLSDLSGLVCFEKLKEFSAKNNKVNDLFEIDSLSNLLYLNLENNKIEELENITFLSNLDKLKLLILTGNPITQNKEYLSTIHEQMPLLENLDCEYSQTISFDNPKFNDTKTSSFYKSSAENTKEEENPNNNKFIDCDDNFNKLTNLDIKETNKKEEYKMEKEIIEKNRSNLSSKLNNNLRIESATTNTNTDSFIVSQSNFKINNTNNLGNLNENPLLISQDNPLFKIGSSCSNILNISIDNSKLFKLNQLNPLKIKPFDDEEEREDMKRVFANHNECLDLEQEKKEILKKLSRKPGTSQPRHINNIKSPDKIISYPNQSNNS